MELGTSFLPRRHLQLLAIGSVFLFAGNASAAEAERLKEKVDALRTEMGRSCRRVALDLANRKCYWTLRECLDLGIHFSPGDEGLNNMAAAFAFIPRPEAEILQVGVKKLFTHPVLHERKHDRTADAEALTAFFRKGLASLLKKYLDEIEKLSKEAEGCESEITRPLLALQAFTEERRWTGKNAIDGCETAGFRARASALISRLGGAREREIEAEKAAAAAAKLRFEQDHDKIRAERLASIPRDIAVESVEGESPIEKAVGIPLCKRRSAHFRIEAVFPEEGCRECLAVLERGLRALADRIQMPVPAAFKDPVKVAVFETNEQYSSYILEIYNPAHPRASHLIIKTGGFWSPVHRAYITFSPSGVDHRLRASILTFTLSSVLDRFVQTDPPLWILGGLKSLVCLEVLGTVHTGVVSMAATTGKARDADWFDFYRWKEKLRVAEKTRQCPSTEAILALSNWNEVIDAQWAKMTVLVDYMTRKELHRFRQCLVLSALPGVWARNAEGEFKILAALGWSTKAFDEAYRSWLLDAAGK